jgi:hypothetical protein
MAEQSSLMNEVETRLEDLFGEEGDSPELSPVDSVDAGESLRDLKALVLSMDWEIADDVMSQFVEQVENLKEPYKNNKGITLLLQLLGSLGHYIKKHKANSHPDAIKVLNSVYASFEKVLLEKDITEAQRRKLFFTEIEGFKALKKKIAKGKKAKPDVQNGQDTNVPDKGLIQPEEDLFPCAEAPSQNLAEMKQFIRSEFETLKAELKSWMEERLSQN